MQLDSASGENTGLGDRESANPDVAARIHAHPTIYISLVLTVCAGHGAHQNLIAPELQHS